MENIKKAYQDILTVTSKYKDLSKESGFSDIEDMMEKAENHLLLVDWYEKYGLKIDQSLQIRGRDYLRLGEYKFFSYYKNAKEEKKTGYGRYISWEDDGKQPQDEWLFGLSFSTGAYIFGDDYPQELMERFWQELKSYEPKYCDSHNHTMYFAIENSSKIFNEFDIILRKYYDINKEEAKQRRIDKLQKELETLKK